MRGYAAEVRREDLEKDPTIRGSVERYLQLAAQTMIDASNHVLSDAKAPPPEDYRGTFDGLAKAGIIDEPFATKLRGWAGFRNVLVHGYLDISLDIICRTLQDELEDIEEFVRVFARLLDQDETHGV